jgi:hypothetical protein
MRPANASLQVLLTDKGKMEFYHEGVKLPGVIGIDCKQVPGERATVTVTFIGLAVQFATEERAKD